MLDIVHDILESVYFSVLVIVTGGIALEWLRRKIFVRKATLRATVRSVPFFLPESMRQALEAIIETGRASDLEPRHPMIEREAQSLHSLEHSLGQDPPFADSTGTLAKNPAEARLLKLLISPQFKSISNRLRWDLPQSVLCVDISFRGSGVAKNVVLQAPDAVVADVIGGRDPREVLAENGKIRLGDLNHGEDLALRVWCDTGSRDNISLDKKKLLIISSENLRGTTKAIVAMPLRQARIYYTARVCIFVLFWLAWLAVSIVMCVKAISKIS